jgi:hypothetical protein
LRFYLEGSNDFECKCANNDAQNALFLHFVKEKYHAIASHRVREQLADKILRFVHVKNEENVSDILTHPLGNKKFHQILKKIVF